MDDFATRKKDFFLKNNWFDKINNLYIVEKHVVEEALKERYLTGQSDRAVI